LKGGGRKGALHTGAAVKVMASMIADRVVLGERCIDSGNGERNGGAGKKEKKKRKQERSGELGNGA